MSFVSVAMDAAQGAAEALEGIGSQFSAATGSAAVPTVEIATAAQDEVSEAVAQLFGDFGGEFQQVSAQARAFHDRFVETLGAGIGRYAATEAAAAEAVAQSLLEIPPTPGQPVTYPVVDYPTPLGPILMTLYGQSNLVPPGTVTFTSGNLQMPPALALTYDTLSPVINVGLAVQHGGTAFVDAVEAGNVLGAATALVQTPLDAVAGFFVGGQYITGSESVPAYSGYTGVDYQIPVGGLLSPVEPVTLTMHETTGATTVIPLSGTRFGGPFTGLADEVIRLFSGL
ncbi:PE family protein [Mycobacterium sp.]|uniref:PE family protein n=1 Tax=Mycobacterium sp. TaxID=1785 RepID=UPI003A89643E